MVATGLIEIRSGWASGSAKLLPDRYIVGQRKGDLRVLPQLRLVGRLTLPGTSPTCTMKSDGVLRDLDRFGDA